MKPDDYRRLVALGLTPEQIAGVMEIMELGDEERKAKGRARWRKYQENKKNANVSKHEQTLANDSRGGDARVEDISLPQKIEPQENKQNALARDVSDFKAALPELDQEQMASLIKHRRAKRGQITAHAAKLFRRDAESCGMSIVQAVETCISRNWITVKPEYFQPRNRGSPTPAKMQAADVFGTLLNGMTQNGTRSSSGDSGVQATVLHLPAVRHG